MGTTAAKRTLLLPEAAAVLATAVPAILLLPEAAMNATAIPARLLLAEAAAIPATAIPARLLLAEVPARLLLLAEAVEGAAVVVIAATVVLLRLNRVQTVVEEAARIAGDRSYFNTSETVLFLCFIIVTIRSGELTNSLISKCAYFKVKHIINILK